MTGLWLIAGITFFLTIFTITPDENPKLSPSFIEVIIRGFGGILPTYLTIRYGSINENFTPIFYILFQSLATFISIFVRSYKEYRKQSLINDINKLSLKLDRNVNELFKSKKL